MKFHVQGFIIGFIMAFLILAGIMLYNYHNEPAYTLSYDIMQNNTYPDSDEPFNSVSKIYTGVPLITPSTTQEIEYYFDLGIFYNDDKEGYCYDGKLVGLFIDRCRNGQGVVFLSNNGEVNIMIHRDINGKMIGIKILSNDVDREMDMYFSNQWLSI